MATLTAFPSAGSVAPVDGFVQRDLGAGTPETFATLRAGAGNGNGETPSADRMAALDASTTTDQYKRMNRSIFGFDLSSIGAGGTISAGVFSLSPTFKNNGLGADAIHCGSATPAASDNLANSDFGNLGSTSFGSIAYAAWTADGGYDDFTLNASGVAHLQANRTGYCFLGVRLNWDMNNTTTGLTWSSGLDTRYEGIYADQAGTSRDPQLVVTYTTGGATNTFTFTADGIIVEVKTTTFTADGIVLAQTINTFTADGIVQATQTTTFTIDGVVQETFTKTFTADGIVLESKTTTFTIDGIIQGTNTKTFTIDGIVIIIGRFFLNGITLPRPKRFIREHVFIKSDIKTISGRSTRDISSRKEKYYLGWDVLSANELDVLLGILEENSAVEFSVNDGNLQIAATQVFPFIKAITYQTPGTDYIAEVELELIEVS